MKRKQDTATMTPAERGALEVADLHAQIGPLFDIYMACIELYRLFRSSGLCIPFAYNFEALFDKYPSGIMPLPDLKGVEHLVFIIGAVPKRCSI